jgi:IS1 family transposase
VDSIFGKVLGFVCGRRTIKTGKVLWQQIKHLPTMGYGTDMLKAYENFIPTRQALRGKDLHHTNRITQLPTEALSSKAPS